MKLRLLPYLVLLIPLALQSATIELGDVTTVLGPDFFIDEASTGGTDTTSADLFIRKDLGPFICGRGLNDFTITGIGWACGGAGTDATQATVTITYLGEDGIGGTADDVELGSRTDSLLFTGSGEYFWQFDTPVSLPLDITNSYFRFRIQTNGTGTIRFKGVDFVPKLSVAGTSAAFEPANVALYRDVTADAGAKPELAGYATDGIVGSDFKWIPPGTAALPQYLEIEFPGPIEIGAHHLYHGVNNGNIVTGFRMEYWDGAAWQTVTGSGIFSNTASENFISFTPITVEKVRLAIITNNGDGRPRIREWAVFPTYGKNLNSYPAGTGVTLNMAENGRTEAGSNTATHAAINAVDSYLETFWQSDTTGPHTFEVYLRDEIKINQIHLHSGESSAGTPIANFTVEYQNASTLAWAPAAPAVTGNTETDLVVNLTAGLPNASAVRLNISDGGQVAIRELQVFPDNGSAADYPLFVNTKAYPLPNYDYETYSDSSYRILSAKDGSALTADAVGAYMVAPADLDNGQIFNVLLNSDGQTYRLYNPESGNCLATDGASLVAGAAVVDEPYGAFPSQQWRLCDAGGGEVFIQNVFSGLYLEALNDGSGEVVQSEYATFPNRKWQIDFQSIYPKKGTAGFPELADDMGSSWWYGWTANDSPALNTGLVDHNPMQWGNFNWDPDNYNPTSQLPLTVRFPDWYSRGNPFTFMGFNEPDNASQSNIAVSLAIELWPQLAASGLPLVSVATTSYNEVYMTDFMTAMDDRELPVDYLAMHTYPSPDNPENIITNINDFSTTHGNRPVILSEFGFATFTVGNTGWPENDMYLGMLELLWQLEDAPNLKRYSLFGFVEDIDNPQPVNPTGNVRRTNILEDDGLTYTAIGDLYVGWDGDTTPNADQPYILHSRNVDGAGLNRRVNNDGTSTVNSVNIRVGGADASAQVVFESIGDGWYYITSLLDGKRLRQVTSGTAGTVEWAASGTITTDAQWSWTQAERGWQLVANRSTGDHLRYTDVNGVHTGNAASPGLFYHWFFVPPRVSPADTLAPLAVTGVNASPYYKQIDLTWTGSASSDVASYNILQATSFGGPYSPIATNVYGTSFTDTGLTNGQIYYYKIETVDLSGNPSVGTSPVSATPDIPVPTTYDDWAIVAFDGAPGGTDILPGGDAENDGKLNRFEYMFLLDPLNPDPDVLTASTNPSSQLLITFDVNRHATDYTWTLYGGTDLSNVSAWLPAPYAIESQTDSGDLRTFVIRPTDPIAPRKFFIIDVE